VKAKIEDLRDEMHNLLNCVHVDYEEVLFVSRKLDKLIVEYYKANGTNESFTRAS
jgi:hypothetical protein